MIEEAGHELDLELAARHTLCTSDRETFRQYSSLLKKLSDMREKKDNLTQLVSSLNEVLGDIAINGSSSPIVEALTKEVESHDIVHYTDTNIF